MKNLNSMCKSYPMLMGFLIFLLIGYMTGLFRRHSGYSLSPTDIQIKSVGDTVNSDLFALPYKLDCTPGQKLGAYYTKDLTPGGLCGGQKFVHDAAAYSITGGIGGSLDPMTFKSV